LYNYAFARHHGGQFILRIEDTDQVRSTRESEQAIFDSLRWVGLPWCEGPDVGGPLGPYRQSERTDIYREHIDILLEKRAAYPCFCSQERLAELRAKQMANKETTGYDGHCARLNPDQARKRMESGEPYVIRMKVPRDGDCLFRDRLRGEISIPWSQVDHQILLKSDGFPTYHLANVVDDHLMNITHVIRGEEWISSTPKHVLLYKLFDWQAPEFIHLPLLRNPDSSKLSKRKNPTSILYYRQAGFLPEALVNYLGLMAYSMPNESETFTLDEMTASFDIDRISLGGPIFDLQKLQHFNGRAIREMPVEKLLETMKDWKHTDETWTRILAMAQPRMTQLGDVMPLANFLFTDRVEYDAIDLMQKGMEGEDAARLLRLAQWEFERTAPWDKDHIRQALEHIAEKEQLRIKKMLPLFFVAVTGHKVSLPLYDSLEMLGRDLTLRRLQYALDALDAAGHPLKGKALKALQKYFQETY
jgi:glutamyl-tRNA synthetase